MPNAPRLDADEAEPHARRDEHVDPRRERARDGPVVTVVGGGLAAPLLGGGGGGLGVLVGLVYVRGRQVARRRPGGAARDRYSRERASALGALRAGRLS